MKDVYETSEEMHAEIVALINIAKKAVEFGIVEILNGAEINFDQAEIVKAILNDIAALEYVNVNKVELYEFVDSLVKLDLSQIDV